MPQAWQDVGLTNLDKGKKRDRSGSRSLESSDKGAERETSTGQSCESGGSSPPMAMPVCRITDGYMLYLLAMHDLVRNKHIDTLGEGGTGVGDAATSGSQQGKLDLTNMSAIHDLVLKELERSWAAMEENKKAEWRSQASMYEDQDSGDKPTSFRSCMFSVCLSACSRTN